MRTASCTVPLAVIPPSTNSLDTICETLCSRFETTMTCMAANFVHFALFLDGASTGGAQGGDWHLSVSSRRSFARLPSGLKSQRREEVRELSVVPSGAERRELPARTVGWEPRPPHRVSRPPSRFRCVWTCGRAGGVLLCARAARPKAPSLCGRCVTCSSLCWELQHARNINVEH